MVASHLRFCLAHSRCDRVELLEHCTVLELDGLHDFHHTIDVYGGHMWSLSMPTLLTARWADECNEFKLGKRSITYCKAYPPHPVAPVPARAHSVHP